MQATQALPADPHAGGTSSTSPDAAAAAAPVTVRPAALQVVTPQAPAVAPQQAAARPAAPAQRDAAPLGGLVDVKVAVAAEGEFKTVLSDDVEIIGTVRAKAGLLLRCAVKGDVIVEGRDGKGGTLFVDAKARVEGVVSASRVIVMGEVVGGIVGRDLLEIGETAKISGPVHYARMRQAEGAEIEGMLTRIREGAQDPTDSVIASISGSR